MEFSAKEKRNKRRRTPNQWQAIIDEFAQSGLGVQEFCQQHDIPYSSFAKWRSRLEPGTHALARQVSFIEIPRGPITTDRPWRIELDLGAGVVLRLTQG